jgi:hypothetical protein
LFKKRKCGNPCNIGSNKIVSGGNAWTKCVNRLSGDRERERERKRVKEALLPSEISGKKEYGQDSRIGVTNIQNHLKMQFFC